MLKYWRYGQKGFTLFVSHKFSSQYLDIFWILYERSFCFIWENKIFLKKEISLFSYQGWPAYLYPRNYNITLAILVIFLSSQSIKFLHQTSLKAWSSIRHRVETPLNFSLLRGRWKGWRIIGLSEKFCHIMRTFRSSIAWVWPHHLQNAQFFGWLAAFWNLKIKSVNEKRCVIKKG